LRSDRRRRLAVVGALTLLVVAVILAVRGCTSGEQRLALPGSNQLAWSEHPLAYLPSRPAAFTARAVSGSANVLFVKSPGGVVATAARVAAWRPLIDAAAKGSGFDPALIEGLVFLESAGYPNALAGPDAADAAGLTQILAQTGQSFLGMHIDLARSRHLTALIDAAYSAGHAALMARLQRQRARIDDRFSPRLALAATIRYLTTARRDLGGRSDLAVVSYHMGIGNLQHVLSLYGGGAVPYVQLYFDTAPDQHGSAYSLLSGFGDDSSLYWWRVLGAEQIMALYRSDRTALARLAALETAPGVGSNAEVLHPPSVTGSFAGGGPPLPAQPGMYGLAYAAGVARSRSLRAAAGDALAVLGFRVRQLGGGSAPLKVAGIIGRDGYSFAIARKYASVRQADAFQAVLDRLQALNLIAWTRTPTTIDVTVASDASHYLAYGP
jgi:hypothetical protein